jgi:hypothetical protein
MMTENRGIRVESREMLLLVKELVSTANTLLAKLTRLDTEPPSSAGFDIPPRNRAKRTEGNGHDPHPGMGLGALLPAPIDPDDTYNVDEAARFLRRSKVSLRKLVTAGKIEAERSGDGSRAPFVFKGSALIKFCNRPKPSPGDDES